MTLTRLSNSVSGNCSQSTKEKLYTLVLTGFFHLIKRSLSPNILAQFSLASRGTSSQRYHLIDALILKRR
ncbi:MAG: hypothetical protein ACI845_000639 [Gammaproteobacteria bacterium]|jgi:hypothetical protein